MDPDPRAVEEANRLYWDEETSVAEIADRLDLSRRALYDALRPIPAGVACDRCGAELEFANRSSRRARMGACPACRNEVVVEAVGDPDSERRLEVLTGGTTDDVRGDGRAQDLRQRAIFIGGAAIAGVALGTVAALLATRRD
jgi:hypothetical protein